MNPLIQPIIACPDSQRAQVEHLVRYCWMLDKTDVRVITIPKSHDDAYMRAHPGADFACLQASGLRYCAKFMRDRPFFWLEPDSIPLHPGWLQILSDEYARQSKPFLISSDMHPPFDLVGGIGFYPPETAWLVPDYFPKHGWDRWLIENLPELIARTPLIQHCYGDYNAAGFATPLLFPRDLARIRPDALVFHRDKFQGLLNGSGAPNVFLHSGDLGDIIAALPIMRQLGGGRIILTDHNGRDGIMTLRPMRYRMNLIDTLLASQPYITRVSFEDRPVGVTHDFTPFRKVHKMGQLLAHSQAKHLGVPDVSFDPWLTVEPSTVAAGKIVACRSARYHNPKFPWARIVKYNKNKIVFCGAPEEHADFCKRFGRIEYLPTPTLHDLAAVIAGSALFIGNQSSPCWIALGLGAPLIQETWQPSPDSIILRPNAQFITGQNMREVPNFSLP